MFFLGLKAVLISEMLSKSIRAAVGLAAQATNEIENVTVGVLADDVLDGFVFGHFHLHVLVISCALPRWDSRDTFLLILRVWVACGWSQRR